MRIDWRRIHATQRMSPTYNTPSELPGDRGPRKGRPYDALKALQRMKRTTRAYQPQPRKTEDGHR